MSEKEEATYEEETIERERPPVSGGEPCRDG